MSWCRTPLRASGLLFAAALTFMATAPTKAEANVLSPGSLSLPVRAPSLGNASIGLATLGVTFTDSSATAKVSAVAVRLGKGNVFHVDTCVKAHSMSVSYDSRCSESTVSTRSNAATISVAAPSVSATLARLASGRSAYFSYEVAVSAQQSDGSFKEVASSWPTTGLADASVGVPALEAASASAPASEGAALSTGATGGVNTGYPDSFCSGVESSDPLPPGNGVSTTSLGDAPDYYEVGEPSGAYEGQQPRGVMVVIHGGGWSMNGPGMVAGMRFDADRWRARGWRTLNITYRPCNAGFGDVTWFYDRARVLWGSGLPYCAMGASAGGDFALMLAAARPTLSCVEDQAGPTDGTSVKDQHTANPSATGAADGPRALYNVLTAAAGKENVQWYSPALFPIHARVLFAVAANDWFVPYAQGTELQSRMQASDPNAYVDLMQIHAGTVPWVHAAVSADSLQTLYDRETQLVAPLTSAGA